MPQRKQKKKRADGDNCQHLRFPARLDTGARKNFGGKGNYR
jgi:hypothetical protein